jgi:CheY-like chemotaxis protein/two-component sensor histidine kinase
MEAQLGQAHRLESVGQLTSGIAHDFNNLLTVILACSDLVERQLTERSGALDELRGAARRGEALIRKLLAFSRQEPRSFEPVDVGRLVRELAPTLRRLLPESIDMQVSSDVALPVIEADAGALEQLLVNLVTNARDAMPWRGNLTVETRVAPVPAGDPRGPTGSYLVLSVSDSGAGMDEATRERMFEPFFSTKPPSEGTGLGLAIVYGLVRQHGGFIDVQSAKGKGTTVDVHLPVPEDQALPSSPDPERVRRAVVLVVEDNAAIRRVARVALEDEGYAVLVASDGVEALRLLDEREVDLVVADVVMPGLTGPELYHELAAQGTPPRFVLTSGYANAEYDETASSLGIPLLRKPWSVVDLAGCVERALEKE